MNAEEIPAAKPECEHYWAFHCFGGLSVRLCKLCHEPDWNDVAGQLSEAERKGELAERAKLQPAIGRVQHLATTAQEKAIEHAVRAERKRIAEQIDLLAAEFATPDSNVGTLRYLAERATFPAIREALHGAAELARRAGEPAS